MFLSELHLGQFGLYVILEIPQFHQSNHNKENQSLSQYSQKWYEFDVLNLILFLRKFVQISFFSTPCFFPILLSFNFSEKD